MVKDEDRRIVVPVDGAGRQLLTFQAPMSGLISGWAIVWTAGQLVDENDVVTRLRFCLADPTSDESALVIRELYLTNRSAHEQVAATREISGRSLREVPLGRFEAAVNMPTAREQLVPVLKVASTMSMPWPDDLRSEATSAPWWTVRPMRPSRTQEAPTSLRLEVPRGYGRPDSFYQEVAALYAHLTTTSSRPANELAEANDVPVTTVHGWVKEARRRGHLPARTTKRGGRNE